MTQNSASTARARPSSWRRPPTWVVALGIGSVLALLYPLLSWLPGDAAYLVLGVAAIVAVLVGIVRNRPVNPWPWWLFASGLALTVLADAIYIASTSALGEDPPFPHVSDVPYIAGMVGIVAGGVLLAWHRHHAATRRTLLDAGIVTTAGGLLLWLAVGSEIVRAPDVTWLVAAVSLAYPLFDTVLLGVMTALSLGRRGSTTSIRLLIGAYAIQIVTDTLYATAVVEGSYVGGGMLDSGWLLTYVLIGTAALHPSMAGGSDPAPPRLVELSRRHLTAMMLPVVVAAAAVLMVGHGTASDDPERFLLDLTVAVPLGLVASLLLLLRVVSATNELARTSRDRDEIRRRELVVADIAARLARSDEVAAVRDAVEAAATMIRAGVHRTRLVLPGDPPTDPDAGDTNLIHERIHLTDRAGDGSIVIASERALSEDERHALERLVSDVVMALDRCRLAEELRHSERRFRSLVRHAPDAITVHDRQGNLLYVSPALGHILGTDDHELEGMRWHELIHGDDRAAVLAVLEHIEDAPGSTQVVEARLRHHDGSWRWVEARFTNLLHDPSVAGIVTNHRDITERQRLQRQLEHQASHDPLTGVANRRRFGEAVRKPSPNGSDAVVFLDLDRFKEINDRLGHAAGDQVLRAVARRLTAAVRPQDLVARLGGDEFAVLLRGSTSEEASATAARLLDAIQRPIRVGSEIVTVAASAGLSLADPDDDQANDLLHDADLAMYAAKSGGRGRLERATPEVRRRTAERLSFEADLRSALADGGLSLAHRPVVDLEDGRLRETQAEMRWIHPIRGEVPASDFLPVAGRIGVLDVLATWIFNEACWSARTWIDLDPDLRVCVPFPGVALQSPRLPDTLEASLQAAGLPGRHLVLQVAGSTLLEHPRTVGTIQRLRELGVCIRVTDFGTNTPMRAVRDVPVDEVLLSAQLVAGLTAGPEEAALGRAVLLLADSFSLEVIAEGISSQRQVDELLARGARRGSGSYLGPAMAPDEVMTTLTAARPTLGASPG